MKTLMKSILTLGGRRTKVFLRVLSLLGVVYFFGMNAYSVIVQKATFGPTEFAQAFISLLGALSGVF